MVSGEATNINFISLIWPDWGLITWSTAFQTNTLTITQTIRLQLFLTQIMCHSMVTHINHC